MAETISRFIDYHEDDRAQRLLDIFPSAVNGQINISYVHSTDHIVAFHRHQIQTDYWTCLKGAFKVCLITDIDGKGYYIDWNYLSDKNRKTLEIPPGTWHGYRAVQKNSIMLYYLTHKYNPSDEERREPGHFGENWETENK